MNLMKSATVRGAALAVVPAALLAFVWLPAARLPAQTIGGQSDYVTVAQGVLHGLSTDGVTEFLGVPFAAPPVGQLRWRPPDPASKWSGTREATQPGNDCMQRGDRAPTSEDCLYLNVYRPAQTHPGARLPVMLFIHGGSNQRGSGALYDPSAIVGQEGIIVVTTNYRLNVFGWLALPGLDTEAQDTSSGNYGLMDQQAALRWVQDNIQSFGGDPAKVTLAGESAGGIDICAQLVSPAAAGLFSQAILESMYCPTESHDEALTVGARAAQNEGCTEVSSQVDCMRALGATQLLAKAGRLAIVVGGGIGFTASPNFGNLLLPSTPGPAIRTGSWNRSRILIGSNHDEAALFAVPILNKKQVAFPPSEQAYLALVAASFGSRPKGVAGVLQAYPSTDFANTFMAYADELTDSSPLGCEVSHWSNVLARAAVTFRYEFNEPAPPTPDALRVPAGFSIGAYHGSELQFLFQTPRLPGPQTPAQQDLSRRMMSYWGNFVKTGNPNGAQLSYWPQYELPGRIILSLSSTGDEVMDHFAAEHRCPFWAENPRSGQ